MKNEIKSTSHSKYRCEYHIVFAPKYRRKIIYKELREDIGQILRKLCNEKKVEIIEAQACPDHIHMLVSIPPYRKPRDSRVVPESLLAMRQTKTPFDYNKSAVCQLHKKIERRSLRKWVLMI